MNSPRPRLASPELQLHPSVSLSLAVLSGCSFSLDYKHGAKVAGFIISSLRKHIFNERGGSSLEISEKTG